MGCFYAYADPMNRSYTSNLEVLQAAGRANNPRHRQLVVKLATNTKAGGTSITTTNVNSKRIVQQLEAFVTTTANSILANRSVALWTQQTYLEVLGTDLGAQILEVLELQQAQIANESTPSAIAPTSPTAETGKDPPLHEVDVPTADTVVDHEEFLAQLAPGSQVYRPCSAANSNILNITLESCTNSSVYRRFAFPYA